MTKTTAASRTRPVRDGDYAIVETNDGRLFLGTVAIDKTADTVTVYTGKQGHPPVIDLVDVDAMTHPAEHPDAVMKP